jgi:phosphoribosyl-ATP pyrophosphohydrolase
MMVIQAVKRQRRIAMPKSNDTWGDLYTLIESRKKGDPDKSYVAKLFNRGINKVCQKAGEEAVEVIVAALAESKKDFVNECADLMFHLTVLCSMKGIHPSEVLQELEDRMGTSGIDEKAARKKKS